MPELSVRLNRAFYVVIPHPVVHFLYLLLCFSTLLGCLLLFIQKEQGSMSQEQGKTCDHSAISLLHPAQNFLLLAPLHNCVLILRETWQIFWRGEAGWMPPLL
jgi:hypothetical protein